MQRTIPEHNREIVFLITNEIREVDKSFFIVRKWFSTVIQDSFTAVGFDTSIYISLRL